MTAVAESDCVVYEPRGAAVQLWKCKAPEVLIEGPAGTGKTRAVLEKVVALADKYPGSRHLICRKTRASMSESVLVTLESKVLPPNSPIKEGPGRDLRRSYKFPNGSTIVVGGLDHPERTFSTEYDTISVFEAIEATENDWESLQRALRNGRMGYHQAIADTNPHVPTHWLNQRAKDAKKMARLLSRHEDNPQFWMDGKWTAEGEQYIARLDGMGGHRRERLRFGRWAAAEGMVYDGWEPTKHLKDQFQIPLEWTRIRAIDFGYQNPFVCQWWAVDGDGRMYLYRELYGTRRLVEDWAEKIKRLSGDERYEATITDHDAEDRATLERHGIASIPAHKSVLPGIEAVSARLRDAGDGRPRLFVMRDCLIEPDPLLTEAKKPCCTEQEFECYVWPKGIDGKSLKEEPVKQNDHGQDAMRYAVAYIDHLGSAPVTVRVMSPGSGPSANRKSSDEQMWTRIG